MTQKTGTLAQIETNLIKHAGIRNKLKLSQNGKIKQRSKKIYTEVTYYLTESLSYHLPKQAHSSTHVNIYTLQVRGSNDPVYVKYPSNACCDGQDWEHTQSHMHAWTHSPTKTHGMDMHTKLRSDTPMTSCAPTGRRTDPDVGTEFEMTAALFTERLFYFSACSHSAPCNITFDNYLCESHLSKYKSSPAHAPLSQILSHTWKSVYKKKVTQLMQPAACIIMVSVLFANKVNSTTTLWLTQTYIYSYTKDWECVCLPKWS